jgi:hypothetical protein
MLKNIKEKLHENAIILLLNFHEWEIVPNDTHLQM